MPETVQIVHADGGRIALLDTADPSHLLVPIAFVKRLSQVVNDYADQLESMRQVKEVLEYARDIGLVVPDG